MADQVLQMLQVAHSGQQKENRQMALDWLASFQNTPQAWESSLRLLLQNANVTAQFFASQTLKHKVTHDWSQLSSEQKKEIKDTLWNTVFGEAVLPVSVDNQLLLALGALISRYDVWRDPVHDLLSLIVGASTPSSSNVIRRVVQILAVIPEQSSRRPLKDANAKSLLSSHYSQVISLLATQLQGSSEAADCKVFVDALSAWISFGDPRADILFSIPLLQAIFQKIPLTVDADEELVGALSELLCEIFYKQFQLGNTPPMEYLECLFGHLQQIHPTLTASVKGAGWSHQGQGQEDEEDCAKVATFLFQIFIEVAESNLGWFIQGRAIVPEYEHFFDFITGTLLSTLCSPIHQVLESSFVFWNLLSEKCPPRGSEKIHTLYKNVFVSLIPHLRYPADDSSLQSQSQFREFRHIVGDCLKDCVCVVGSTEIITICMELLAKSAGGDWKEIEAILFALRSISSSIDTRESEALPVLFPQLLSIGAEHAKIVYSNILLIGCYAEWCKHRPALVPSFIEYLLTHFWSNTSAASMAMKYLFSSCQIAPSEALTRWFAEFIDKFDASFGSDWPLDVFEAFTHAIPKEQHLSIAVELMKKLSVHPSTILESISLFFTIIDAAELEGSEGGSQNRAMADSLVFGCLHFISQVSFGDLDVDACNALVLSICDFCKSIGYSTRCRSSPESPSSPSLYSKEIVELCQHLRAARNINIVDVVGALSLSTPQLFDMISPFYESPQTTPTLKLLLSLPASELAAADCGGVEAGALTLFICQCIHVDEDQNGASLAIVVASRLLASPAHTGYTRIIPTLLTHIHHLPATCTPDVSLYMRKLYAADPDFCLQAFDDYTNGLPSTLWTANGKDALRVDFRACVGEGGGHLRRFLKLLLETAKRRL